ncbi:MAG: hypothetical protein JNL85_10915 [Rubrivivax sp.]|nr:hypothetical protein [Rubrivivax sp.]
MNSETLRGAARIRVSSIVRLGTAGLVAVLLAGCVVAPPRHVYPRVRVWVPFPIWFVPVAGYRHSEGSYDRDRYECYRTAVRETGIDPGGYAPLQERASSPSAPPGAEVAAGAAVGAVAGGIVGSPRNAGAGMVIGALLGAAVGAAAGDARAQAERAERAEREAREARESRSRRDSPPDEMTREEQQRFRSAMSECMERRGYRSR